jgi:uncharacterized protein GlcG (DUF336 family)
MRHKFCLAFAAVFAVLPLAGAVARGGESGYSLPRSLAVTAATKAIATCASNCYPVSAVVVDPSGTTKLEAKGDHSTIHTTTYAYHKAYTVMTTSPIFRFAASSTFAALAGGLTIKSGDEIVAALGVSGLPGGEKNDARAQAGVVSIKDDLASGR